MAEYENWSDAAIRNKLAELGHPVGPITETTRKIIIKKLARITTENKNVSISGYSSGEDESKHRGGPANRNRVSMPPPPSSYKRKTTSRSSLGSFGSNSKFDSPSRKSTNDSLRVTSSRTSPRLGRRSEYDFDSGSDSDYRSTRLTTRNSSANSSHSSFGGSGLSPVKPRPTNSFSFTSTPKESRWNLPSLTRRSTASNRNDVNNIKESDDEDSGSAHASQPTPSIYSRLHLPFPSTYRTLNVAPRRTTFATQRAIDSGGWLSLVKQRAPVILLASFLVFFLWLAGTYCHRVYLRPAVTNTNPNIYPTCTGKEIGEAPCIPPDSLKFAVNLYRDVHQTLLMRAVRSLCGPNNPDGSSVLAYMTQRELVRYLLDLRPADVLRMEAGVKHLALLLIANPHWGVSVMRSEQPSPTAVCAGGATDGKAVPSDITLQLPLVFTAPCPDLTLWCRVRLLFYTSAYYAVASLIVGALMYGLFAAARYYWRQAKEQEEEVMRLVEKILHLVTEQCGPQQHFLPIRHVHDMLLAPKDRQRMEAIWQRAVHFLDTNESRVRREVQPVHGEDTAVWRLLAPASPPPSPTATPPPSPPLQDNHVNHLYPDLSEERLRDGERVWQGEAFETGAGAMNALPESPTQCLKIRHMFKPNIHYGANWELKVRDAIIEKCEGVRLVHIKVDSASKEGCVYLKCASSQDAGEAFRRLHGSWFDGALVTVKYLRLERYHERFPDAIAACHSLKPSNNLRLSLGGRS